MKSTQLTQGKQRRLMYVENKSGAIDGFQARIGWVTFSKTGNTVYYRGLVLNRLKGGGVSGNFADADTGSEFWVSGVKKRGSNVHWATSVQVHIDEDARLEYLHLTAPSAGSNQSQA
jgi:hypothetical protein